MKKILRQYSLAVLIFLASFFLFAIVGFYVWGIRYLVVSVDQAIGRPPGGGEVPQYNLDDASKLDYRGILPRQ